MSRCPSFSGALRQRPLPWTIGIVTILGAALRIFAFAAHASFSIDEAALGRDVIASGWRGLFEPLPFAQVAPPMFLCVQKLSLAIVPNPETALRLFPLLAGCASIPIAVFAARRLFTGIPLIVFGLLIALSTPLIAYSATAKQYAFEPLMSAAVIALTFAWWSGPQTVRRAVGYAVTAASTVLFSFAAVFTLAAAALGTGVRLFQSNTREDRLANGAFAVGSGLGALVGVSISQHVMTPADAAYMKWFWDSGFLHITSHPTAWLWTRLTNLFSQTMHYRGGTAWVALLAVGVSSLVWRRLYSEAALLAGGLVLALGAAVTHLYPFTSGRVTLFLIPSTLMLALEGASLIGARLASAHRFAGPIPLVLLCGLAVHARIRSDVPPEIVRHPVRPFLEQARQQWRPGDHLFVHYDDAQPFLFYADRYDFNATDYTIGPCVAIDASSRAQEDGRVEGAHRVWVAMSHTWDTESAALKSSLAALNAPSPVTDDESTKGYGFVVDLRAVRPSTPSHAVFAYLPPDDKKTPGRWGCYGVFAPNPPTAN